MTATPHPFLIGPAHSTLLGFKVTAGHWQWCPIKLIIYLRVLCYVHCKKEYHSCVCTFTHSRADHSRTLRSVAQWHELATSNVHITDAGGTQSIRLLRKPKLDNVPHGNLPTHSILCQMSSDHGVEVRGSISDRTKTFLSSANRPADSGPTEDCHWWRIVDQSPSSGAYVKNEWSYTSASPTRLHCMHRDNTAPPTVDKTFRVVVSPFAFWPKSTVLATSPAHFICQ